MSSGCKHKLVLFQSLTLTCKSCDLNHVFKYSRSVCQVVEQATLWSVPGGEGVTWTPCYLLLCPDPGRMPLQIPGPHLWKRRAAPCGWRWLPGSKSPGNTDVLLEEEEPASWVPSCLARHKMCLWHRQKAIITQDLAFFHVQPFCCTRALLCAFLGGRVCAYFSFKRRYPLSSSTKSRPGSFLWL